MPDAPLSPEVLDQLGELVRAAVRAEMASARVPALLDGTRAREYLGLSRSSWFRALSTGELPRPIHIDGAGDKWRKRDLDAWLERKKPARRSR